MKKAVKWIGIAVLTPILLFVILAVLIYLPPIQNWAVQKVATIASEQTGMEITVGHVTLEWPLDLGIDDFRVIKQNDSLPQVKDTIADVRHLVANVKLGPLFRERVVIKELSLRQTRLNTNGFISDLRIKGYFDELWLSSKGIDLSQETVEVNGARVSDARLDIALSDTAEVDTTESTQKWLIRADSLTISKTSLLLHLPGDTMSVGGYLGRAVAREADIDLGEKIYKVKSLDWHDGRLAVGALPQLNDIRLGIDSISYTPAGTSLYIRQAAMKEQSGLEVTEVRGGISLDPAFNRIQMPGMVLRTADSDIEAEADLDLRALDANAQDAGQMKVRLNAQVGKQDLMLLMGDMPQRFVQHYPNHPLNIKGSVNGNVRQMELTGLDITLPTALHLTADGTAENVTDMKLLKANVRLHAQSQSLNFVTGLLDPKTADNYRVPDNMTLDGLLKADGNRYETDLTAKEGNGEVSVQFKGEDSSALRYDLSARISNLNLHHFMPKDSLYTVSGTIQAKGYGTDLLDSRSRLEAEAEINQFHYGQLNLSGLTTTANLSGGRGIVDISGRNDLLNGRITVDALLNTKRIDGTISADVKRIDLQRFRLVENPLVVGLCGHVDITSDMKQTHHLNGIFGELFIQDEKSTFRPDDIGLLVNLRPDTTYVRAQSGDFIVKLDGSGGYEKILSQLTTLGDSAMSQLEQKIIDQPAIKRLLPTVKLHVESQRNNPIANLLRTSDIDFKELYVDLTTSPESGINATSYIYSLNYDSIRLDTLRLNLAQKGDRLTYNGQVRNNRKNPQFIFNLLFDGHIHEHGALAGLRYYDDRERMGVRIGATAEMEQGGIRLRLLPDRPTLGYKEFNLNKDNYIFLTTNRKITAKVDLIADDKTGLKIYTENQDSTMLQDLTVSINRLDLGEITSSIPYLPHITGRLNGDYHILQDQNEQISVASDMAVSAMTYEGSPIGNISTELVYLQKESDGDHPSAGTHALEARLMLDEEEFGLLSGTYQNEGEGLIDATVTMTRMPLSLVNGFVPDQIIGLDGYGEGSMTVRGTTRHPDVNGEVYLDSAYLVSQPYGVRMRFDNDPLRIVGSKLLLENFGLYAYNDEPLNMMGNIDFNDTEHPAIDLRMRASNLLLINAKQEAKSLAFGKAFVNFMARMQGPLDGMRMRGRLDVLGSTDMTYMLLDSPLSTDNRLDELVKFTDFSDSTQTVITRPTPSGLDVDLTINVSQGAHIVCNLNAEQTNYVDLMGGGDLRMRFSDELSLTGRYTLSSGEMKYSLPVIPLKTFTIKNGSYVEFSGDPMNPRLNITATERTKATVGSQGGQSRSVTFDCGVVITKTLNDMGLEFVIEAPEDQSISGELNTMSTEERGKLAVTMLTTGMYLADGNTSSFSMNSALSSFLQSEINNITGSALKTLDLSVGIDNSTDASGAMHTDYSFKFAKRFLDNRLKIELGGKVSSGSDDAMGQKQSFFDNVTMEYRLNQDATQNVKLFYKQNVYDWLEGYTNKYGGGFVWRRQLDNFWDIFRFWRKEQQPMIPMRPQTLRQDSIRADSIKAVK